MSMPSSPRASLLSSAATPERERRNTYSAGDDTTAARDETEEPQRQARHHAASGASLTSSSPAAEGEEEAAAEQAPLAVRDLNLVSIWRKTCIFLLVYLTLAIAGGVVALIVGWDDGDECEASGDSGGPLRAWFIVLTGINLVNFIFTLRIYLGLPVVTDSYEEQRERIRSVLSWHLCNRCIDVAWLVWAILGAVWTFSSDGGECRGENPLWVAGVVYFSVHMALLYIGCCCCCSTAFRVLIRMIDVEGGAPPGASKSQIKRNTETVKFRSTEQVAGDSEHNTCGICLDDYAENDELRILPCKHHFHADCVDNWLKRSKSCPYCKRVIDAEEEDEGRSEATTTTSSRNATVGRTGDDVGITASDGII